MAIRGEAPTVLLLATETDSEWTGSSARSGGVGSGSTSLATSSGVGCGDSNASSSGSGGSSDDGDADRGGGRSTQPPSASSSTTAASLNIVVDTKADADADAGADAERARSGITTRASVGNAGAAGGSLVFGAAGEEAGAGECAPSLVRSPLPLSSFAAPSLADTKDFRDHRRHKSGDTAAGGGDEGPPGLGAEREGDVSAPLAIGVNSGDRRLSRRASAVHTRGGRSASVVQLEVGKGGRKSIAEEQPADNNNAPNGANRKADDDSDEKVSGGAADSARLGGSEGGDDLSGWGGILDADVRCAGSGNCPLHEAAASGSVGAVLSLLDLGADVSIVNGHGDTALHVRIQVVETAHSAVVLLSSA